MQFFLIFRNHTPNGARTYTLGEDVKSTAGMIMIKDFIVAMEIFAITHHI